MINPPRVLLPTVSAKNQRHKYESVFVPLVYLFLLVFLVRALILSSQNQRPHRHRPARHTLVRIIPKPPALMIGRNRSVVITKHRIPRSFVRPSTVFASTRMIFIKQHPNRNLSFRQLSKKHAKTGVNLLFIFYHFSVSAVFIRIIPYFFPKYKQNRSPESYGFRQTIPAAKKMRNLLVFDCGLWYYIYCTVVQI